MSDRGEILPGDSQYCGSRLEAMKDAKNRRDRSSTRVNRHIAELIQELQILHDKCQANAEAIIENGLIVNDTYRCMSACAAAAYMLCIARLETILSKTT